MNKEEVLHVLDESAAEIRRLRRENEVLAGKVHMIQLFENVLYTRPNARTVGAGEDIAHKLEVMARGLRNSDEAKQ